MRKNNSLTDISVKLNAGAPAFVEWCRVHKVVCEFAKDSIYIFYKSFNCICRIDGSFATTLDIETLIHVIKLSFFAYNQGVQRGTETGVKETQDAIKAALGIDIDTSTRVSYD